MNEQHPGSLHVLELHNTTSKLLAPRSTGVLVAGGFGSGKHEFAASILELVAEQTTVVQLHCDRLTAQVPLAALTPLLNDETDTSNMLDVYRDLRGSLNQASNYAASGIPTVIGIDQSGFLDQETSYVLAQLVQSGLIRLLIVAEHETLSTSALEPIAATGALHVHQMELLSSTECSTLAAEYLPGHLTAGSMRKLVQLTGGIPELVMCVLASAANHQETGRSNGYCQIDWAGVLDDEHLHDMVLSLLTQLPDSTRTVIEMSSLGGALDPKSIEQILGENLDSLFHSGLLSLDKNGAVVAGVGIVRQVVAKSTGPGRSKVLLEMYRESGELLLGDDRNVCWALKAGEHLDESIVVAAAHCANTRGSYSSGYEIAVAVLSKRPSFRLRIELFLAEAGLGRTITAQRGMESLGPEVSVIEELELLSAAWLLQLHLSASSAESYAHAAEAWREIIARLGTPSNVEIADRLVYCETICGSATAAKLAEEMLRLARQIQSPDVRLFALTLGYEATVRIRWDNEIDVLKAMTGFENQPKAVRDRLMAALISRGLCTSDFRLISRLKVMVEESGEPELQCVLELFYGWFLWREGKFVESEQHLAQVAIDFAEGTMEPFAMLVVPYLSMMQIEASSRVASPHVYRGPLHLLMTPSSFRLAVMSHWLADESVSEQNVRAKVLEAQGSEDELQEMMIYWRLLLGSNAQGVQVLAIQAPRIRSLVTGIDNPDLNDFSLLVDALNAGPDACAKLISSSEKQPWELLLNFAAAGILHKESVSGQLRSLALNWLYGRGSEGRSRQPSYIGDALTKHGLTEREHEIVRHVISGRSNREIAVELTLSVRTIEGHIYRIFGKLGIADRTELRQLSAS